MILEKREIEVTQYNNLWPEFFAQEASAIKQALGDNLISIHHIGSTSIPGLYAKPKIDIGIAVKDLWTTLTPLTKIGYKYSGEWNIPIHMGFCKREGTKFNLHVYKENNPCLEAQILFRDFLLNNQAMKADYQELKKNLLSNPDAYFKPEGSMYTGYTLGKDKFIKNVLRQAGFNRNILQFCVYENEIDSAKKIINQSEPKETFTEINFGINDQEAHFVFYHKLNVVGYAKVSIQENGFSKIPNLIISPQDPEKAALEKEFLKLVKDWVEFKGFTISY